MKELSFIGEGYISLLQTCKLFLTTVYTWLPSTWKQAKRQVSTYSLSKKNSTVEFKIVLMIFGCQTIDWFWIVNLWTFYFYSWEGKI